MLDEPQFLIDSQTGSSSGGVAVSQRRNLCDMAQLCGTSNQSIRQEPFFEEKYSGMQEWVTGMDGAA